MSAERVVRAAVGLLAVTCMPLAGQQAPTASSTGAFEAGVAAAVDTARLRNDVRALVGMRRVAGSPGAASSAAYVLSQMASAGLDTSRAVFEAFLPYQDSAVVERTEPKMMNLPLRFILDEPVLAEDSTGIGATWPAMNAYSGVGDVRGPVIYVNYGLAEDYAALDSLGVSVKGAVVLARYGRAHRGTKAFEAERHGAVALVLYSDPADDGYYLGDTWPQGPMRQFDGVERGSLAQFTGDAATPGKASVAGAARLSDDALPLPRIPTVPIGYRNAFALLPLMSKGDVPQSWQGAFPFRYHSGPTDVTMRVGVWAERGRPAVKPVINTFGVLRGTDFPDELVIIGAHRDAWGPGAVDNAGGTAVVTELARAFGELARRGMRPRRTIIFATWDAEEWGLVGSTEWVEGEVGRLRGKVVAYINEDMVATGPTLGASASGPLQRLVREVVGETALPVGVPGGGSDHVPFQELLGAWVASIGFSGPQGVYHSSHDTPAFVERFADPGYLRQARVASLVGALTVRLANAELLPLDLGGLGAQLRGGLTALRAAAGSRTGELPLADVERALDRFDAAARSFDAERSRGSGKADPARIAAANRELLAIGPLFTREPNAERRPTSLLEGTDPSQRYAPLALPGVQIPLRAGDLDGARAACHDLADRIDRATAAVQRARRAR